MGIASLCVSVSRAQLTPLILRKGITMTFYIYPYHKNSASAKSLGQGLSCKRIRREGSRFRPKWDSVVINWGNSHCDNTSVLSSAILNHPSLVGAASNKRVFFDKLSGTPGVNLPEHTMDVEHARTLIPVVVREKLTGHSGEGIVILNTEEEFQSYDHSRAKLYVKYIKKVQEYRVHVVCGQVVDRRRKALRNDFPREQANWQVRNHSGVSFLLLTKSTSTPNS